MGFFNCLYYIISNSLNRLSMGFFLQDENGMRVNKISFLICLFYNFLKYKIIIIKFDIITSVFLFMVSIKN